MRLQISLSAVPMSLARPYMGKWDKTRYHEVFNKYGSGNGTQKHRIYVPYNSIQLKAPKAVKVPKQIENHLSSKNMSVDDYLVGTALMPDGKRRVRLGKVLSDVPELKKLYDNDKQRTAVKGVSAWIVFSKHPYDIIGMSFDRGWTSCMHLTDGGNKEYLKGDVELGTIVAYVVKENDKNINAPIARIALRPLRSKDKKHVFLMPGPTYGAETIQFTKAVQMFAEYMNHSVPDGTYVLDKKLYADDIDGNIEVCRNVESVKRMQRARKIAVAESPATTSEVFEYLISEKSDSIDVTIARNPSASVDILRKLLNDESDWSTALGIALNDNADAELLGEIAKRYSKNTHVMRQVALHENTSHKLLNTLASEGTADLRRCVARNKALPTDIAVKLAKDKDYTVRDRLAGNEKCPTAILKKLSTDQSLDVIRSVALNKSSDAALLTAIFKNANTRVLSAIAYNPNCPVEIMRDIANRNGVSGKYGLAGNKNAPTEILDALLLIKGSTDEHENIRKTVLKSSKVSAEAIAKFVETSRDIYPYMYTLVANMNTPTSALDAVRKRAGASTHIRERLTEHPNASTDMLKTMLKDIGAGVRRLAREALKKRGEL